MAITKKKDIRRLRPEYFIDLNIGETNFNSDLMQLVIYSSIKSHFNYVLLEVKSDAKKFLVEKIYGREPIQVRIHLTTPEMRLIEDVNMELMLLKSNLPIAPRKRLGNEDLPEPAKVQIIAVPRRSINRINKTVNKIFHNKLIKDVITELITQTGSSPDILESGLNPHPIDQIVVPALPFGDAIKYIHEKWGICSGPLQYQSHFSEDKIIVRDLAKSVKEQEQLVIHQLALDAGSANIIKKCTDGINYYTRHFMETSYDANIVLGRLARNIKHIVQPSDKLTHTVEYTIDDLCKEHGIISKSTELIYDETLKQSELFIQDSTGFDTNPESCYQKISRQIPFLSKIVLNVEGDMKLLNLTKVGFPVLFRTYTVENLDLDGKYVLTYSRFSFDRDLRGRGSRTNTLVGSDIWTTTCKLTIARTTKVK